MTIQAGVVGATGYTGFETIKLLAGHPEVELVFAASKSNAGKRLSDLYPTQIDIELASVDAVDVSSVDVAFLCLPHGASQEYAKRSLDAGAVVIDLSADYRLRDVDVYETW